MQETFGASKVSIVLSANFEQGFISMDTGEKILNNAYELFKRFGVRSVTMDEIAGQSGVSKKTVYQFFEDKDTLVENVIAGIIAKSEQECGINASKSENAIHELILAMEMSEQMIDGANPAVMNDLRKYHSAAYDRIEHHKQQFMTEFVRRNIERGVSEGLYRDNLNLDVIAPFILHSLTVAIEQDIFPKIKHNIAAIDSAIALFLLHGLANVKGVKMIEKYKQQRLKTNIV